MQRRKCLKRELKERKIPGRVQCGKKRRSEFEGINNCVKCLFQMALDKNRNVLDLVIRRPLVTLARGVRDTIARVQQVQE